MVGHGVERAEATVAVGREERRLQEAFHELIDAPGIGHESLERPLSLDAPRRTGVLVPLDASLVIRRGTRGRELDLAIGRQVGRTDIAREVDDREGVREVVRQTSQRRARLLRRLAGLEHVADDDRNPETRTDDLPASEGERDREAGIVKPVQEPPAAISRTDHRSDPARVEDRSFEPLWRIVVVPREHGRLAPCPDGLRAPREVRRRRPHREEASLEVTAACKRTHALVGRHELGHVLPQRPERLGVRGSRRLAFMKEPRLVAGPMRLEEITPSLPRFELLDRLEGEH